MTWVGFVRAVYLAVAIFGSLPALAYGLAMLFSLLTRPQSGPRMDSPLLEAVVTLGCLSAFLIPGFRAIRRRIVSGTVIPAELIDERPTVTGLVTLAGVIGHLFLALFVASAIDIALAPVWPDEAGKIIILVMAAMFFYLVALLCGELALVGNGKTDAALSTGSGPIS